MHIHIKHIYEPASDADGFRILVDRLWPRGLSREKAHLDLWLKEIAPSDPLRRWFNHEAAKWEEFQSRYQEELRNNPEALAAFTRATGDKDTITLLYAAHDEAHNQAVVLREYLLERTA